MSSGELSRFYKSRQWRQTRNAYLESRNRICERCGRPASIVHHRRYLNNRNLHDMSIALSFDNLEALCYDCHNKEHFKGLAVERGLTFDSNGNLIKE